jgi:type IV pilus assembly protein PilY1
MNAIRDIRAKTLASTLSGIVLLSAANSYADVSQTPLSLTIGVPPNMLVTLDDSGSMRWAFAPDNVNGTHATRRAKSSARPLTGSAGNSPIDGKWSARTSANSCS